MAKKMLLAVALALMLVGLSTLLAFDNNLRPCGVPAQPLRAEGSADVVSGTYADHVSHDAHREDFRELQSINVSLLPYVFADHLNMWTFLTIKGQSKCDRCKPATRG